MVVVKMLGLYLSTLIIGHTSCNMLNKLTLQRELQNCVTNKVKTQQQQNEKSNTKTPAAAGN